MGNSQASTASASSSRFVKASRAFSKQELDGLRALFASLAAQSQTGGRAIFLEYYGVRGPLGERLFQLVAKESGGGDGITLEDLIISKATYVKGTRDEVEEFIHQLCDVTGDGILSRSDLESVLASIHEAIFAENKEAGKCSINRAFEASLNSAVFSKDAEGISEKSMSLSDFKNWCVLMPSLKKLLGNLLMPPDSGRPGFQAPILHYPENIFNDFLLLNREYAWHIGGGFSQNEVQEWKLLYHSFLHGQSTTSSLPDVPPRKKEEDRQRQVAIHSHFIHHVPPPKRSSPELPPLPPAPPAHRFCRRRHPAPSPPPEAHRSKNLTLTTSYARNPGRKPSPTAHSIDPPSPPTPARAPEARAMLNRRRKTRFALVSPLGTVAR